MQNPQTPASAHQTTGGGSGREVISEGEPGTAPVAAVKAGGWVFTSGQLASDERGELANDAHVDPEAPYWTDGQQLQARRVLKNLGLALAKSGCDIDSDVVRVYQWFPTTWPDRSSGLEPRFSISPYLRELHLVAGDPRPASTALRVRGLPTPWARLSVDAIAFTPETRPTTGFTAPPGMGAPLAGYSPAVRRGDWVFLSGMIATDFSGDFGSTVHRGDSSALAQAARVNPYFWFGSEIEAQMDYTLEALQRIAERAGTSFRRVVKATVYLSSPMDWPEMDRVWRRWFPDRPPARAVIPLATAGVMGARVEIAMKLIGNDSALEIEPIETSLAPEPIGHEPQAVRVGNFVFFSSQLPIDSTGRLAPVAAGDPSDKASGARQIRFTLDNLAAISEAAGTTVEMTCRAHVYHGDLPVSSEERMEWGDAFPAGPPATTHVELGSPMLVPGAKVLVDAIGFVPANLASGKPDA